MHLVCISYQAFKNQFMERQFSIYRRRVFWSCILREPDVFHPLKMTNMYEIT